MDNRRIGNYIKEQRIKNKLSQRELSSIIHVTRQAVSNWENGKSLPDSEMLVHLSEIFNTSINEMLLGNDPEEEELQKMTLQLIDENNRKRTKIRNLFKILIIVLGTFLLYYFLTTYNSIKVYVISGKSKNYAIESSILVHTNQKTYIKIGNITPKEDIKEVTIYYILNNVKKDIYKGRDLNSILVEEYGYGEYFNRNFDKIKDNLYIKIKNSKREEVIKLKIKEDFKNDELFSNNVPIKDEIQNEFSQSVNDIYEKIEKEEKSQNSNNENNENIPKKEDVLPVKEDIDYEKVVAKIKEKGTSDLNGYKIIYQKDNSTIGIGVVKDELTIEFSNNNIIESWTLNINTKKVVQYVKYDNFIEIENIQIDYFSTLEKDVEIVGKMKEILNNFIGGNY